jgi:TrmH family RNA methyltransferase
MFISLFNHVSCHHTAVVLGLQQHMPRVAVRRYYTSWIGSSGNTIPRHYVSCFHRCGRRQIAASRTAGSPINTEVVPVSGRWASSSTSSISSNSNGGRETPSRISNLFPTSQIITSKASSTVKLFSNLLTSSKIRRINNLTVVEGYRLVLDILGNPSTSHLIQHLLVTEEALYNHTEFSPILQQHILNNTNTHSFRVHLATESVLAACTDTVTPQGVVATCTIPDPFDSVMEMKCNENDMPSMYLVVDAVSDPGNMGTLIRSSVACGVSAIFLLHGCVDPYSSKALRSAMGGTFRIPLKSFSTIEECWDVLHKCGVPNERIYAATLETIQYPRFANNIDLNSSPNCSPIHTDIDWVASSPSTGVRNSAIIIGREGSGLRPEIRDAVVSGQINSVHVAMEGGMESLNAAVCGSVVLFEYARQKREYARHCENINKPNTIMT